jgi:hypothetical protein
MVRKIDGLADGRIDKIIQGSTNYKGFIEQGA